MKIAWALVLLFPLIAFCAAGMIELRSDKKMGHKLTILIPSLIGVGSFAMACGLGSFLHLSTSSFLGNGRIMAMLSGIIASSGSFIGYSSKRTGILMALGGLELMFLFIFFNEPLT